METYFDRNFLSKITLYPKQDEALKILDSASVRNLVYGGAAGGAKSFLGCYWQLRNRLRYPGTRGLIGRAKIRTLRNTTLITFFRVAALAGLKPKVDFILKPAENLIVFNNGSEILLKDLFYYPSDPEFVALGGLEITDAFIDEGGEVSEKAWLMVNSRIRLDLTKWGLSPKLLITCNPTKNWIYNRFYKPWSEGNLPVDKAFLHASLQDHGDPEFTKIYSEQLSHLDTISKERLLLGNWDYADDALALFPQVAIDALFSSEFIDTGHLFIAADVARYGSDKTVIGLWAGWRLRELISYSKKSTDYTADIILQLQKKHKIPAHRIMIDADGIGGGVVDKIKSCLAFNGAASPIQVKGKSPNYKNLKSQCAYLLSEKMCDGGIYIEPEVAELQISGLSVKEAIANELRAFRRNPGKDEGKLAINSKDNMKMILGHSPDLADMFLIRMALELKQPSRNLTLYYY